MSETIESARDDLLSDAPEIRERGVRTVEDLAARGNPLAIYATATWYLHGTNGYMMDLEKAKLLLETASQQLVPEASYDLAVYLEKHDKSRNRNKRAFGLYVISALLGDLDSLNELRRCFYWGIGTFKDRNIAEMIGDQLDKRGKSGSIQPT